MTTDRRVIEHHRDKHNSTNVVFSMSCMVKLSRGEKYYFALGFLHIFPEHREEENMCEHFVEPHEGKKKTLLRFHFPVKIAAGLTSCHEFAISQK